jgi:polygalacturonase
MTTMTTTTRATKRSAPAMALLGMLLSMTVSNAPEALSVLASKPESKMGVPALERAGMVETAPYAVMKYGVKVTGTTVALTPAGKRLVGALVAMVS